MDELLKFVNKKINEELREHNDDKIILVCGPTGSGKSTLANYLAGIELKAIKKKNFKK